MTSGSPVGTATSAPGPKPALAVRVRCDEDHVVVTLADGRTIRAHLTERLRAATPTQRDGGRVEDLGTALHWPEIDEDLSVAALLGVSEEALEELAGFALVPREG